MPAKGRHASGASLAEHTQALEGPDRGWQEALAAGLVHGERTLLEDQHGQRRDRRRRSPPPGPPVHRRPRRRRASCRRDAWSPLQQHELAAEARSHREEYAVVSRGAPRRRRESRRRRTRPMPRRDCRPRRATSTSARARRARARAIPPSRGAPSDRRCARSSAPRRGGGARARRGSRRRRQRSSRRIRSGMPPVRTTRKPVSSISHPMISSVSGKKSEREATTRGPAGACGAGPAGQDHRRGAVTEQRGRDDVGDRAVVELQRE
jgi:hypothetical protein